MHPEEQMEVEASAAATAANYDVGEYEDVVDDVVDDCENMNMGKVVKEEVEEEEDIVSHAGGMHHHARPRSSSAVAAALAAISAKQGNKKPDRMDIKVNPVVAGAVVSNSSSNSKSNSNNFLSTAVTAEAAATTTATATVTTSIRTPLAPRVREGNDIFLASSPATVDKVLSFLNSEATRLQHNNDFHQEARIRAAMLDLYSLHKNDIDRVNMMLLTAQTNVRSGNMDKAHVLYQRAAQLAREKHGSNVQTVGLAVCGCVVCWCWDVSRVVCVCVCVRVCLCVCVSGIWANQCRLCSHHINTLTITHFFSLPLLSQVEAERQYALSCLNIRDHATAEAVAKRSLDSLTKMSFDDPSYFRLCETTYAKALLCNGKKASLMFVFFKFSKGEKSEIKTK